MSKGWVCIARFGGIGDNLMAASPLPLFKRLGYMTEVLTSDGCGEVFRNNPYIDKLTIKNVETELPQGNLEEWQRWLNNRGKEYDIFVHLSHSCEGRHSVFPSMTMFWLNEKYRRKQCAGSFLETVHDIADVPYEFGPLFFPTEEETDRAKFDKAKTAGPSCVGWVISGSRIDKLYPYTAMAVARIIRELDAPVILFGAGDKEFSCAKSIMEHVERTNGSVAGLHLALSDPTAQQNGDRSWPIRRSLSLLLQCDLIVSPDTGPAWAVAMEQMPKIIKVSHASVENITKHWVNTTTLHADPNRVPCWPCHRLHNDISTCTPNRDGGHAAACISDISVETIIKEIGRKYRMAHGNNVVEWPRGARTAV